MVKNIVGEYNEWSEPVDVLTLVHVDIVGEVMVVGRPNFPLNFVRPIFSASKFSTHNDQYCKYLL